MKKTGFILLVLLTLVAVCGESAQAQRKRADVGIKLGVITRMSMTGARDLQSDAGASGQLFANFPIAGDFQFPFALDFHRIGLSGSSQMMLGVSGGLKRTFSLPKSDMLLRPSVSLGFAFLADIGDIPASQYLTYEISVEAVFRMDNKRSWVGELAFLDMPRGTMKGEDIQLGFGLLLRFGISFS